jgi:nickel superoxide dismutase
MGNPLAKLIHLFPAREVEAHCDIPCGIYDPISAKIAAQTVLKMVMRIQALQPPSADSSAEQLGTYSNTLGRYVTVKEEHAQLCKKELLILWSDYFKPEHLEKYPELHSTYWDAAKLCSTNKQQVNSDAAKQLVEAVDKLAGIYWATKNVSYKDEVARLRFGT